MRWFDGANRAAACDLLSAVALTGSLGDAAGGSAVGVGRVVLTH